MGDSILIGDYSLNQVIGSGTFGSVYLSTHIPTGLDVAVKRVERGLVKGVSVEKLFRRELAIIQNLDHPFIAEFYDVMEDEKYFYIVMEYVDNGTMLDFINSRGSISEDQARHYLCQLISVLEYLHCGKHVCHRDLKAENILLDSNYNIRLIDFGLANVFSVENPFLKTSCGSPQYAPPEMLCDETSYTAVSDIWSIGIILYAMVHKRLPFDDDNIVKLFNKVRYAEPIYKARMSPQLKDLLRKMLTKEPRKRITLRQIKEHPWFSQYQYSDIMNLSFGDNYQWQVMSIDSEIVADMKMCGYDVSALTNDLLTGKINQATTVYRIKRKNKIVKAMASISLESQNSRKLQRHPATNSAKDVAPRNMLGLPHLVARRAPPLPLPRPTARLPTGMKMSKENKDGKACRSNGSVTRPPPALIAGHIAEKVNLSASKQKQAVVLVQRRRSNSLKDSVVPPLSKP